MAAAAETTASARDNLAFKEFMSAFRSEMLEAKNQAKRAGRFVPSRHSVLQPKDARSGCIGAASAFVSLEATSDDDDYDYWPDELVPVGIAADEPQAASTSTTASSQASSTTETEGASGNDSDHEDFWPAELLVG